MNDGGPAFPLGNNWGMSLRDYFAAHAPEPEWDRDIQPLMERERIANPHNDTYKPIRRSQQEIIAALKYAYADAMIAARGKQ